MKICFVGPTMGECGGMQRVIAGAANALAQHHKVDLISYYNRQETSYYPLHPSIELINKNQSYITGKSLLRRAVQWVARQRKPVLPAALAAYAYYPKKMVSDLAETLQKGGYDCVIASGAQATIPLGMAAPKLKGMRLIGWHHNSYGIYFQTPGMAFYAQRKLAEKMLAQLDCLVTLTGRDALEYQEKMHLNCKYIYNPLSFRSEEKSDVSKKNLLFVSRLEVQQKGLDFLADIAEELFHRRGYRDWKLQIVGSGSGYRQLETWIQERKLMDQVELLGEQKEVQKFYCNASVFLSTSRWEGFGVVITEAMECGLPVVAFETDGPMEIISAGENGYLIPKYQVEQFADAVEKLMTDEELRWKMSRNAIKRAGDFYPEKVMEKWEELIRREA